jgi:hypothetical protein
VVPVTAEELLAALSARRSAITSLRARAQIASGVARLWTREAVVVRRPSAVRIDVLSRAGLVLALGTEGASLWAYPPMQAVRYEGPASPENLARFLGAPVSVPDLVDILLGVAPQREPAGRPRVEAAGDGEYRLAVPLAEGIQTLWFATDTHRLLRAEEARAGRLVLRVAFGDYRDGFPHALEVSAPDRGAAASLTYETAEPNAEVDPALFVPPPAPRVLPLEAAPE